MDGITAGVDLAASAKTTAMAMLYWSARTVTVESIVVDVDDDLLLRVSGRANKIGIDCPFGWPQDFITFITAHHSRGPLRQRAETAAERKPLLYRATDRFCQKHGMQPLSVSGDLIAHPAFRCARLLDAIEPGCDRSGIGRCVETYPAGSLLMWKLANRGYKGRAHIHTLQGLAKAVARPLNLRFADSDAAFLFHTSDHAFDAVVAAITARCQHLGLVKSIPSESQGLARVEGWIAVPTADSLGPGLFG